MKHLPEEIKDEILQKATLSNVLKDYHQYHKKKGSQFVMDCPKCGEKDKLEFNEPKNVAKCFKCDIGVKTPVNYLTKFHGKTFVEALVELARIEMISTIVKEEPAPAPVSKEEKNRRTKKRQEEAEVPYVQTMLAESGLTTEDITASVYIDDETRKEVPVYLQGTVDSAFEIRNGDDVIIRYYDLDGKPMTYYKRDRKGNPTGKPKEFYRVRYQTPELHPDKHGNPVKYRSPYGSDTKIYINKWIREKYKKASKIQTLYFQEGEKKADKATKHGLISIGIMGIHNIAYNKRLPPEIELIIKKCQVENVVFLLDNDWNDLSSKIDSKHPADNRPRSFFTAVSNFKDHFYAFSHNDIHLNIFFGYVKDNPQKDKGIDDLLANSMKGKEDTLKALCNEALLKPEGNAEWLQFHKITTASPHKLLSFWHLENKDSFANHYQERLKKLPKFRFKGVEWRFNENGVLELAQPLLDYETFWNEQKKRNAEGDVTSISINFNHKRCYTFLQNRGFYRLPEQNNSFIWVNINGNVVKKVETHQIKDFVIDFTSQLNKEDVENMLYRGGKQYLGPDSLGNLKYTHLNLHEPSKNMQYLYFADNYFKITDENIEVHELKDLPGQVWEDNIKDFKPTLMDPMIQEVHKITELDIKEDPELAAYKGEYLIDFSEEALKCDFLHFLLNTSIFFGKNKSLDHATWAERFETSRHFLSKVTAFGYMLHRFRNANNERAIIGMDGQMSEVGKSNGRSGKSLFGVALEQLVPTVTIPGKKKDLLDDKFLFEEVDQRTAVIFFDDVRVNFDFEFLFPYITGKFTLEKKGIGKMTLPREFVQKFYIATNHALSGEGGSFEDRQFLLGYSDWYNQHHKPIDDFGCMFFDEWDEKQWNRFYNFAALALHLYFKHGLIAAPTEKLLNRKLRQDIGESFLDWAEEYFSREANVNVRIYKQLMYDGNAGDSDAIKHGDGFVTKFPGQRKWCNITTFKSKMKAFCKFKGWDYNPSAKPPGSDIKTGGKEFIEVFVPEAEMENIKRSNYEESVEEEVEDIFNE